MANRKTAVRQTAKAPERVVGAKVVTTTVEEMAAAIGRHIGLTRREADQDKTGVELVSRNSELQAAATNCAPPSEPATTTFELVSQIDASSTKLAIRLADLEARLLGAPTNGGDGAGRPCPLAMNDVLQSELNTLADCHAMLYRIGIYLGWEC